ncbi:Hypothetical_protein [Hexamita inflata]|uniref:Hypothetical_protein n=1 Tax=Hexamita inflata TaxID=28002 RepID=A0AA86PAS0_9EUKA|nr:Hypothetical protein HINF_LOCUS22932 [Hexamita inflata]
MKKASEYLIVLAKTTLQPDIERGQKSPASVQNGWFGPANPQEFSPPSLSYPYPIQRVFVYGQAHQLPNTILFDSIHLHSLFQIEVSGILHKHQDPDKQVFGITLQTH